MTTDPRPENCRFRLQDESHAYLRSGCNHCGRNVMTGLGNSCPMIDKPEPTPTPIVTVQEMKTSAGTDYFVHIRVADRTVTPHVFKQRWKAEYEVDHWKWIFGQRETQPDIMNYGPERRH